MLLEGTGGRQKAGVWAKVTEQQAKDWLKKKAIWQIYLPATRHIPRPKFDVLVPNEVHQADLLFMPHDRVENLRLRSHGRWRCQPLQRLARLRQRSPMAWLGFTSGAPCGGRSSFKLILSASSWVRWASSELLAKHSVQVQRGRVDIHQAQGIVERWNRTLADRLFGNKFAHEISSPLMNGPQSGWSGYPLLSQLWMEKWPGWLAKSSLMPLRLRRCAAAHKSPLLYSLDALLVSKSRKSPRGPVFATFITTWSLEVYWLGDQAWRSRVVLPTGRRCPTARFCMRGAACGAIRLTTTTGWGPQALRTA